MKIFSPRCVSCLTEHRVYEGTLGLWASIGSMSEPSNYQRASVLYVNIGSRGDCHDYERATYSWAGITQVFELPGTFSLRAKGIFYELTAALVTF